MSEKNASATINQDYTKDCVYPQINPIATGKNLKRLRLSCNLTQDKVASYFPEKGVTPSAISQWEHGKNMPNMDRFIILGYIYGNCALDELIVLKYPKKEAS